MGASERRRPSSRRSAPGHIYKDVSVLHSDAIGLAFEVERTVSEGGDVETVVSQVLVPWPQHHHVLLVEERT